MLQKNSTDDVNIRDGIRSFSGLEKGTITVAKIKGDGSEDILQIIQVGTGSGHSKLIRMTDGKFYCLSNTLLQRLNMAGEIDYNGGKVASKIAVTFAGAMRMLKEEIEADKDASDDMEILEANIDKMQDKMDDLAQELEKRKR